MCTLNNLHSLLLYLFVFIIFIINVVYLSQWLYCGADGRLHSYSSGRVDIDSPPCICGTLTVNITLTNMDEYYMYITLHGINDRSSC